MTSSVWHASSMSTMRPKYSTEMHQNTSFCAELNGEHAGEGFMPLPWNIDYIFRAATIDSFADMDSQSWKIIEFPKIWPLTCHNWVKCWPRTKNNTTNREYSARAIAGLFSEALRRFVWKRQGGRTNPPTPTPAKVAKPGLRARVKVSKFWMQ